MPRTLTGQRDARRPAPLSSASKQGWRATADHQQLGRCVAVLLSSDAWLGRPDMCRHLTIVRQPQKLPTVLTKEEVRRLIEAAPGIKYKAALGVAYGAGLRVSEVANLKVSDIDSKRMLIRVEQGKGKKDRYAMLSPQLLAILRDYWSVVKPRVWLFPGRDPVMPITTRQLYRVVRDTAEAIDIKKRVSPHVLRHLQLSQ